MKQGHATGAIRISSAEYRPGWGTAHFDQCKRLILTAIATNERIAIDIHRTGELILGRMDVRRLILPDVDLSDYDAKLLGISRQHAQLKITGDTLYINDMGSTNGTFVNEKRLVTHQPHVIRDGDILRLSDLKLRVAFVPVNVYMKLTAATASF